MRSTHERACTVQRRVFLFARCLYVQGQVVKIDIYFLHAVVAAASSGGGGDVVLRDCRETERVLLLLLVVLLLGC